MKKKEYHLAIYMRFATEQELRNFYDAYLVQHTILASGGPIYSWDISDEKELFPEGRT